MEAGDIVMLNDPFRGGTHLPDITLVMPVYVAVGTQRKSVRDGGTTTAKIGGQECPPHTRPDFYVASRAHHADVGGTFPGSMGPCREIYQEGFRIPPVKIMRQGKIVTDVLALLLNNVRTPEEREGDLGAQIAACQTGARRLQELCSRYGVARAQQAAADLLAYSEELVRKFVASVPAGIYRAEDFLDDDGITNEPVRIAVSICVSRQHGRGARKEHQPVVTIDFSGTSPQVQGAVNAVEAIAYSACFYVFRCLLREDVPATAGLMRPIRVIIPSGTVVNAEPPAAVAGGNVETSQRIVDVLLKALAQAIPEQIPAAAAGTMNNLTIGGVDPRTGEPFAYYETIAGGMGARSTKDGVSGVHTHMTNSLNTPAEALEHAYPVRLRQYSLRPGSGGSGLHTGGDGIVREIEILTEADVTLLADRRQGRPYGLNGGEPGAAGRTEVLRANGSTQQLAGKASVRVKAGERIRVETPGGGGWGRLRAKMSK
jgi:N-methylhydantoinase B